MLGWLFRPRCPVDEGTRDWVDFRYEWFEERFGSERLGDRVVCPTPEDFPERFDGSEQVLGRVAGRIAARIGVALESLDFAIYDEEEPESKVLKASGLEGRWSSSGSAGHFVGAGSGHRHRIGIEVSTLRDPMSLVATLAHEICHARLLGEGHLHEDEPDMEPVTDLATVFFGYGVFTANSLIAETQWQEASMSGWSMRRQGYLDFPVLGYALARHARQRREDRPAWARHLRPDARDRFQQAMRYLRRRERDPLA